MTYGLWLDRGHTALDQARAALPTTTPLDQVNVSSILAERNRCLTALTHLATLLAGVTPTRRPGTPTHLDATTISAVKDPTTRLLLGALPQPVVPAPTDTLPAIRPRAAALLHTATDHVHVAGDILASHVNPRRRPRTPEGAAISLGAGRQPAIADLAALTIALVHVDHELLTRLDHATADESVALAQYQQAVIDNVRSWSAGDDLGQLHAVANLSREPALIRQLQVAAALQEPYEPRIPLTVAECGDLIDDFRLWAFRHPNEVTARHVSAAARVGLLIATLAPDPTPTSRHGWRDAVHALSDLATRTPRPTDLRATELTHIASLLRSDPEAHQPDQLAGLADRLPNLANTIDTAARQLIHQGALLTARTMLATTPSANGIRRATIAWVTATIDSPASINLLDALAAAATSPPARTGSTTATAPRVFPPLDAVTNPIPPQPITHPVGTPAARPKHR